MEGIAITKALHINLITCHRNDPTLLTIFAGSQRAATAVTKLPLFPYKQMATFGAFGGGC